MFGLHAYDIVVIVVYLVGIAGIGVYVARRVKDTAHYFIGNRSFGKLLMIGQAFGVGTHAEQPVAVAGKSYQIGLSGIWYQWKYIFCTPFYWLIAPVFRRLRYITSAEYMEARYGQSVGILYTVYALLFFMLSMSAMLNGAAKVVDAATGGGVPHGYVMYSMTVIFIAYSFFGGLISSAVTDFIESFLIIILSVMLLPAGFSKLGGFDQLRKTLSEDMFLLSTPGDITVVVILLLSVQSLISIFAQPHHMAVVGSGRTEANCRVGFTYGNFIKRLCTLGWALVGLIVAAMIMKGLTQPPEKGTEFAFGLACRELLGPGFMGLMIACVLAANMSTCSAFMVNLGALFVQNIYKRYLRPNEEDSHYLRVGRTAGAVITLGSVGLTYVITDVLDAILRHDNFAAFMGIPFLAGLIWRRANAFGAFCSFIIASAMDLGLSKYWYDDIKWHADVFAYSMGGGIASLILGSLLTRRTPDAVWNALQERLHTPASVEESLEGERQVKAREAEENGEGLIIADLLRLHRTFSFKRYRKDLVGFAMAWGVVVFLIGLAWMIRYV